MKNNYLCLLFAILFVIISVGIAQGAKPIVLKHASYWDMKCRKEVIVQWWCNEIEKRTKGNVKFEHYLSGSLLKVSDLLNGTAQGVADFSCVPPGYFPSQLPLATVWDMPFIHTSPWVQQAVIRELLKTYPPAQEEWHKNGVHAIFNGPCSGGGIYTSKKQVKTLEDLKGQKLRTYGYVAKAVNRLGGVSVSLPVPEMYTAIQRGTVDGAMFWLAECEAFKLHEITKYFVLNTGLDGCCSGYAFMNLKVWNNLPSSVKEVIEQLDNEWVDAGTRLWVITELKNIDFMNKKGMKIYILPDEERARWTEKVNPDDLHAEWVKVNETKYGAPAGDYLKKVKQLIKKYREQDIFRDMYKVCLGGSD